jgi:hypothetical protein
MSVITDNFHLTKKQLARFHRKPEPEHEALVRATRKKVDRKLTPLTLGSIMGLLL